MRSHHVVPLALAVGCATPTPPASPPAAAVSRPIEVRIAGGRAMPVSSAGQAEIARLVSEAQGDGPPAARAERLVRWVHTHVRFTSDRHKAGVPQPVQTLDASFNHGGAKDPYAGRVFVLVDHGSASSGESAPELLRAAMGATIVGERTAGYAEFGNERPYVMPRTGVVWQLGSKRNYYAQPRDGVGHPVDYYLPPAMVDGPVAKLLPLLERLPRGTRAARGR